VCCPPMPACRTRAGRSATALQPFALPSEGEASASSFSRRSVAASPCWPATAMAQWILADGPSASLGIRGLPLAPPWLRPCWRAMARELLVRPRLFPAAFCAERWLRRLPGGCSPAWRGGESLGGGLGHAVASPAFYSPLPEADAGPNWRGPRIRPLPTAARRRRPLAREPAPPLVHGAWQFQDLHPRGHQPMAPPAGRYVLSCSTARC